MPTGHPKIPRPVKTERVCSMCGLKKPNTSEFFQLRSQKVHKLGLQSYCRACNSLRTKDQHAKRRVLVLQHYSGSLRPFCSCCGESHLEFLSIDHVDGGGGKMRREKIHGPASSFMLWLVRNNFPPGFRVLCHNCNLALGFYGRCPHQGPSTTTSLSVRTSREASPPQPSSTLPEKVPQAISPPERLPSH